jgi:hypothetical protein
MQTITFQHNRLIFNNLYRVIDAKKVSPSITNYEIF